MRWLLMLWLAIASAGAVGQADFDEWERRMLAGEHGSASEFAEGIATRHPESSVWAYRAGASLSRAGALGNAIVWLEAAAERGYSGVRTIETDSDLDPVRAMAGFAAASARVRANAAARMASFREAADEAEPIVVLPRGHDASEPVPLVIALHGTGGTGREMVRAWRGVTQRAGAVLIAPDALRPAGNGFAWVFRDESEWYVEHLIADARAKYAVGEVVIVGFSQGANTALAMGRSHPELFDAVVAVAGHWEADVAAMPAAPGADEDDRRPAWCLLIGERDPWHTTYDDAEAALHGAGMRVRVTKVPRLGHAMPRARELHSALDWCLE